MTGDRDCPLVDRAADVLCLGAGWHAVECVDPDGTRSFWLLGDTDDDTPVRFPRHELLGPLPADVAANIRRHRCGRPTLTGQPCRTPVARPGLTCAHHRATEPARRQEEAP